MDILYLLQGTLLGSSRSDIGVFNHGHWERYKASDIVWWNGGVYSPLLFNLHQTSKGQYS